MIELTDLQKRLFGEQPAIAAVKSLLDAVKAYDDKTEQDKKEREEALKPLMSYNDLIATSQALFLTASKLNPVDSKNIPTIYALDMQSDGLKEALVALLSEFPKGKKTISYTFGGITAKVRKRDLNIVGDVRDVIDECMKSYSMNPFTRDLMQQYTENIEKTNKKYGIKK